MAKKKEKIDLENPDFKKAWQLLQFTRNSVFLTGKAGSGKSTFLRHITSNTRKKYVVLAPTGIAAVNVGGQTLHSFFRLPLKPVLPDDPDFSVVRLRERMKYPRSLIKLIKNLELIIIDEISMVRADTMDFIDRLLRVYGNNMREPFGGKQMLLVGDIFQLEPVITTDMRQVMRRYYPHPYFFNARVFNEMKIVPIELRKVYRQRDNDFVELLDRLRLGRQTREDIALLNSRCQSDGQEDNGEMVMTLATRRDMVDNINERHLREIRKPEFTYHGKVSGDFPESSLPAPLELTLKEGAQVVFIKNDRDKRWVNGTIVRVSALDSSNLEVTLEDGSCHDVEPEVWSNIKYEYDEKTRRVNEKEIGSFTQYPVRLAWALTIHKSQGLTFNKVIVDMGRGAFSSGQSYVALSRCTSLEGMRLRSMLSDRDVFVNPAIVDFSREFNDDVLIEDALHHAEADVAYRDAAKALDRGDFVDAFDQLVKGMTLRNELDNKVAVRMVRRKLRQRAALLSKLDEANDEIGRLRRKMSSLAVEYVSMGDDCREGGIYDAAIANYEKALDLDGSMLAAMKGMAGVYRESGDRDKAVEILRSAVSRHPGDAGVYVSLSTLYRESGSLHDALEIMLLAADRIDKNADIHDELAAVYQQAGDDGQAANHKKIARALRRKRK